MSPEAVIIPFVAKALATPRSGPLVVGLCGAQGSGKSTLAAALVRHFPAAVALSLDDFYLTRARRRGLADEVHPLFATRGVPGTHDIALACDTFAALDRGEAVRLPRFDKAADDRLDEALWPCAPERCELVIFEGWCVGARPQPDAALALPINSLEYDQDASGAWRRYANAALADYRRIFARLDRLILLRAPDWTTVLGWRLDQERALRSTGATGAGVMSDAEVERFVSHYERLTRHILDEMPARADLVLQLNADRSCAGAVNSEPPALQGHDS